MVNGHMRDLLVGRTVEGVEDIFATWDALYYESIPYGRKGIGVMALSGIDLALWDLLARSRDVPVYAVIGPRTKDKIDSYATGIDAEWYAELGFRLISSRTATRGGWRTVPARNGPRSERAG